MITSAILAQDLSQHQWQNRLLVIVSQRQDNPLIKKQLNELSNQQQELEERRLLTYIITPEEYRLTTDKEWTNKSKYATYSSGQPFEVLLIGLDGAIKQREFGIFKASKLISIIDAMPMRQAEMRRH